MSHFHIIRPNKCPIHCYKKEKHLAKLSSNYDLECTRSLSNSKWKIDSSPTHFFVSVQYSLSAVIQYIFMLALVLKLRIFAQSKKDMLECFIYIKTPNGNKLTNVLFPPLNHRQGIWHILNNFFIERSSSYSNLCLTVLVYRAFLFTYDTYSSMKVLCSTHDFKGTESRGLWLRVFSYDSPSSGPMITPLAS